MDSGSAIILGGVYLAVAGLIAFFLHRLVSPGAETPDEFRRPRSWAAWAIAMVTVPLLARVFNRGFEVDRFATWLFGVVVLGGLAFLAGWIWARLTQKKGLPAGFPAPSREYQFQPESRAVEQSQPPVNRPVTKPRDDLPDGFDENSFWAAALQEFESPQRDLGTWARAFAESGGNEAAAKAEYLKARKAKLQADCLLQIRNKTAIPNPETRVASEPTGGPERVDAMISAVRRNDTAAVQSLLAAGVDPRSRNGMGLSPLACAHEYERQSMIWLFQGVAAPGAQSPSEAAGGGTGSNSGGTSTPVFEAGPSIRERILAMSVIAQDNVLLAIDLAERAGFSVEQVESAQGETRFRVQSKSAPVDPPQEFASELEIIQWVRAHVWPKFMKPFGDQS